MTPKSFERAQQILREKEFAETFLSDNLLNHAFIKFRSINHIPEDVFPQLNELYKEISQDEKAFKVILAPKYQKKVIAIIKRLDTEFKKL